MSEKQYTRPFEDECSQMFLDANESGVGGCSIYCSCGIEHIAIEHDYNKDCNIPPESDHVKHHPWDYVSSFELNNKVFVRGCEGCEKTLRRYEDFIWENRDHIRNYLKIRIDQEKRWADQEHMLNVIAGISK